MALCAIMMQEGMVIGYESKNLNNVKLNYPIYEKQIISDTSCIEIWHHYIYIR